MELGALKCEVVRCEVQDESEYPISSSIRVTKAVIYNHILLPRLRSGNTLSPASGVLKASSATERISKRQRYLFNMQLQFPLYKANLFRSVLPCFLMERWSFSLEIPSS